MRVLRALPRSWSRLGTVLVLGAWVVQMGALVHRSYVEAASVNLAADLAPLRRRRAVEGRLLPGREDRLHRRRDPSDRGRLRAAGGRPAADGAAWARRPRARLRTLVQVDRAFACAPSRSPSIRAPGPFPSTGASKARGSISRSRRPAGSAPRSRDLPEAPALSLNLPRRLAAAGLTAGAHHEVTVVRSGHLAATRPCASTWRRARWCARRADPMPAFRRALAVRRDHVALVGDRHGRGGDARRARWAWWWCARRASSALQLGVPDRIRSDMLEAAAVVPDAREAHRRHRRRPPAPPDAPQRRGAGGRRPAGRGPDRRGRRRSRSATSRRRPAGTPDPDAARFLAPEPFIESDAPEIVAEAQKALADVAGNRARAERLVRHVNALLEKKPTVSLPSAREVLRTQASATATSTRPSTSRWRAPCGIPARIAVGLVYLRGAFYYHAWPEVYVGGARPRAVAAGRSHAQPVPADATHMRLARGGLDRQAAILPLIGTPADGRRRPGAGSPARLRSSSARRRRPTPPASPLRKPRRARERLLVAAGGIR